MNRDPAKMSVFARWCSLGGLKPLREFREVFRQFVKSYLDVNYLICQIWWGCLAAVGPPYCEGATKRSLGRRGKKGSLVHEPRQRKMGKHVSRHLGQSETEGTTPQILWGLRGFLPFAQWCHLGRPRGSTMPRGCREKDLWFLLVVTYSTTERRRQMFLMTPRTLKQPPCPV